MNHYLAAILSIIIPILPFITPGITACSSKRQPHLLAWGARLIMCSLVSWILVSYAVAFVGLPAGATIVIMGVATVIFAISNRQEVFSLSHNWFVLAILVPLTISFALFSLPLLKLHDGLPTGDAQKAILWAQDIIESNRLPDYQSSVTRLNRDPVDFYTPGLHSIVAAIMVVSPLPLHSVSFFSIMAALTIAVVGAAMSKDLFDTENRLFPATLVALLILSNIRFLRYVREPGYHLQNSVGEFLVFALLMIGLSLIHRWRTKEAILGCATLVALFITHQFSSFVGLFMLLPVIIVMLLTRRHIFMDQLRSRPALLIACIVTALAIIGGGFALGLHHKIPHIFTSQPHLTNELPTLAEYPGLLGKLSLGFSIGGVILLILHIKRRHPHYLETIAFLGATLVIILLSQGPRLYIDIPPVRALLYAVTPLAICAAYFIAKAIEAINPRRAVSSLVITILFLALIAVGAGTNIHTAFATISHTVRSNSTLTPGIAALTVQLDTQKPGAIIVDDYDRRASSWLMVGNHPVFSRVAAEGSRQMNESAQSPLREKLYYNQLDFEKIYSLGNWPGILPLLQKHNVSFVTGVTSSSASAFVHNPLLATTGWADDLVLFGLNDKATLPANTVLARFTDGLPNGEQSDIVPWLLKPATVANDIGDNDDTFNHMAASVSSTRLSTPQFDGQQTYRVTHAPQFVLRFNVRDYVGKLWDKDGDGQVDIATELFIRFAFISPNISLHLPSHTIDLEPSAAAIVSIKPDDIIISPEGFLDLEIDNPTQEPVAIDMIAIGPARVP